MSLKILLVCPVFPPEPVVSASMAFDVAKLLSQRGHSITVITGFPNKPGGQIYDGYKLKWKQVEVKDGFKIIRVWYLIARSGNILSKFFENITFGLTSFCSVLREQRFDIAYVNTWPIFAQAMIATVLKFKKTRFVTEIVDIYPESLIDKQMLAENGLLARIMRLLDRKYLNKCAAIATISPIMRELLVNTRSQSEEKVNYLPLWLDETRFDKCTQRDRSITREMGISDRTFVAVFAGNFSISAGLDMYVKVAELLKQHKDIALILAGGGSKKNDIAKEILKKKLSNIFIKSPLSDDDLIRIHASADLFLLSLAGNMVDSVAPSKQIAYMLSGRPIVASLSSDSTPAKIIADGNAGFVLPPDDSAAVADLLIELSNNSTLLEQMGNNARKYALENYSKSKVLPKLAGLIESIKH